MYLIVDMSGDEEAGVSKNSAPRMCDLENGERRIATRSGVGIPDPAARQRALLRHLSARSIAAQRLVGGRLVANADEVAALPDELRDIVRRAVKEFEALGQLQHR